MLKALLIRLYGLALIAVCLTIPASRRVVIFGGFGIISMGDWARALDRSGIAAVSVVPSILPINNRDDFDATWMDLVPLPPTWVPQSLRRLLAPAFATAWIVRNCRVAVGPVDGVTALSWCGLHRAERWIFRRKGIRVVTIPVGGDVFALHNIQDPSLRFGLQASYPERIRSGATTLENLRRAEVQSDVFLAQSFYLDLLARTDVVAPQHNVVDTRALEQYAAREAEFRDLPAVRSARRQGIRILHASNHRPFKGTEFIERAVDDLRSRGLEVELVILDREPRDTVLREIARADIIVDQVLFTGYALLSIEAMAMGKPVLCNLEDPTYRQLMTRYSILSECPVVSVSPETITERLYALCRCPEERSARGRLGITYVERYHSFAAWARFWSVLEESEFDGARLTRKSSFEICRRWSGDSE